MLQLFKAMFKEIFISLSKYTTFLDCMNMAYGQHYSSSRLEIRAFSSREDLIWSSDNEIPISSVTRMSPALPLDIWNIIFRVLTPPDLLSLE
jgi:hypothetical protein